MKKSLLLVLVFVFVLASMSSAAIRYGVGGSIGPAVVTAQPTLVIGIDNKDNKFDIVLGYSNAGQGDGEDSQIKMIIGGTWYLMKNGNISAGPSLYYFSDGRNTTGTSAGDNTITAINVGFTTKADLLQNVELRADTIIYSLVSGKLAGFDVKSANQLGVTIQISGVFYFM